MRSEAAAVLVGTLHQICWVYIPTNGMNEERGCGSFGRYFASDLFGISPTGTAMVNKALMV
jgi:hypothetical protein